MKQSHSSSPKKEKANPSQETLPQNQPEQDISTKRWEEAIFHENHVNPRSYHSAVVHKSSLFVFGGYECNQGILNDFICLDLEAKEPFIWKTIEKKKGTYPEPLHRHTAIVFQGQMFIYGGKTSVLGNSKKVYCYNFATNEWSEESCSKDNEIPFSIDSHNAVLYEEGSRAEMIVFGGFLGKYSKYSNNVFAYDLISKEWKFYYKHQDEKQKSPSTSLVPKKRANSSMILVKNSLLIFGGCKGSVKMNDFWSFDLLTCVWSKILYDQRIIPEPRSGHIFLAIQKDKFLLFGGIHDIAHEKNDVLYYEEGSNQWSKVEEDSMKNLSESSNPSSKKIFSFHKNQEKNSEKTLHQTLDKFKMGAAKHKKTNSVYFLGSMKKTKTESSRKASTLEGTLDGLSANKNPNQLQEERKKKERQMKKSLLLSEFEITEEIKSNMIINSPTTEAMKNSILAIKTDSKHLEHKQKIPHKESANNFMVGYNCNTIKGKKPCARDGCTGSIFHDKIIIFGGDRHLMAFHDLYFLNFKYLN